MNILIIPFHDWRKIQIEGFRTRDAHFIEEFSKRDKGVNIIVNRPTTYLEILLKRKTGLIKGQKLLAHKNFTLYRLNETTYLIDYISFDMLGQIVKKFAWFMEKYTDSAFHEFISRSLEHLNISDNICLVNQNIFAAGLVKDMVAVKKVFDAWDNFMKFDVYFGVRGKIKEAYSSMGKTCDFWITNSSDNIDYFKNEFDPRELHLIKNGVDLKRFSAVESKKPDDLKAISGPIAGFGGKITHLLDVQLINDILKKASNVSFVFVGQILNKEVFDAIEKTNNFYYLGDKHYDEYVNYVRNFDVCIVPYVIEEERKSGANTIKVYEYLAAGKKVVGTPSNGLEDLSENVYLVNNSDEFANELKDVTNRKQAINLFNHSWANKTNTILNLLGDNGV